MENSSIAQDLSIIWSLISSKTNIESVTDFFDWFLLYYYYNSSSNIFFINSKRQASITILSPDQSYRLTKKTCNMPEKIK